MIIKVRIKSTYPCFQSKQCFESGSIFSLEIRNLIHLNWYVTLSYKLTLSYFYKNRDSYLLKKFELSCFYSNELLTSEELSVILNFGIEKSTFIMV